MGHKLPESEIEEFTSVYREFMSIMKDHAEVQERISSAADLDGIEARFAEEGTEALFKLALKMRNNWAEIIVDTRDQADKMEAIVDRIVIDDFVPLIKEQITTMRELADSIEGALECKDKLINSRLKSQEITPATLNQVKSFEPDIAASSSDGLSDIKSTQDVYMMSASKDVEKIGTLSSKRTEIIESIDVVS
jgi:Na+/phosphate symporter